MKSMKEQTIEDYILSINFNEDWSVNNIKNDLKTKIGEEPGVEIVYDKDVMINEVTGESKEFKKMSHISVIYTDLDDKIKSVKYLV